jgi:hypothetical protein
MTHSIKFNCNQTLRQYFGTFYKNAENFFRTITRTKILIVHGPSTTEKLHQRHMLGFLLKLAHNLSVFFYQF